MMNIEDADRRTWSLLVLGKVIIKERDIEIQRKRKRERKREAACDQYLPKLIDIVCHCVSLTLSITNAIFSLLVVVRLEARRVEEREDAIESEGEKERKKEGNVESV